jgi:PAS domain S-box-containing protein
MKNSKYNRASREELLAEIAMLRSRQTEVTSERGRLHSSEPFVDVLIDSAMFPIVITNGDDGMVLYINNIAADYFSISIEDARVRNSSDFWESTDELKKFLLVLEENGRVVEFEAKLLTAKKVKRHTLLSAKKIIFYGKEAVYTVLTDVTDRKMAEAALQESEARYHKMYCMMKLMTNTVTDMIWAKDLDDNYIFANRAIREKLLMCQKGESPIGKPDLYFANRERSSGYKHTYGEVCVDSDDLVKRNRQPGRFLEDGLIRGNYLVLDVNKAPLFDEDGKLIGTVGAGRDVTQDVAIQKSLEESDKRFRLLVDNIRDVLWVSDVEFNPTYVTPSVQALTGYSKEEFLSLPISVHMTPKYKKKFNGLRRMMGSMIKNRQEIPARFFEFECLRKDGDIIWVEIITTAMSDSDGSLQGFTGVIRDSTKRVREQKELEMAKEVALAASQTKSEFLANMSHEIRTPMNGVLGILQLLKDTPLNQLQAKYVETALSSGTSLLNLISDILDFSKIEAGKIELIKKPLKLDHLLNSVVESFESLIDKEKVLIAYSIGKNVPSVVVADESRLKQILFNLVGNAVKFTDHGWIDIELNADIVSPDLRVVLNFTICDSGRGIAEHMIGRLFEPFVQEDGSFRRKYGGTGLGLSIVKKLVEMMGGEIRLQSTVQQGTIVFFNIKATVAKEISLETQRHGSKQPVAIIAKRVLVVEDERINAMVISAMLNKMGHDVHLATNGRQALQKVAELEFDCIFMDIQMPELDGVETTQAIRSTIMNKNRKVPIVALTAHAMKGDRERFISAGMDDYLAKPVEMDNLIQVLLRLQGLKNSS